MKQQEGRGGGRVITLGKSAGVSAPRLQPAGRGSVSLCSVQGTVGQL